MKTNRLKLNDTKTELLPISADQNMDYSNYELTVGKNIVDGVSHVRNLGVTLDSNLNLRLHISNICRAAYAHLRAIGRIRGFLSNLCTQRLVQALVIWILDIQIGYV